jgi:tetratricopeptide (TPR) repeat protein
MTRLQSWKEIASHLGRDVRTVQRWERTEGLPVHRHQHRGGATVHAFVEELEQWRRNRDAAPPAPALAPRPRRRWPAVAAAALAAGAAVAATVLVPVGGGTRGRARGAHDAAAREAFLRGQYLRHRGTLADVQRAVAAFEEAIARESDFAAPHAALAEALDVLAASGVASAEQAGPRIRSEASRALSLDPALARAHAVAAGVSLYHDWDWHAAEAGYRRALALDSGLADIHHAYAQLLSARGRHGDALTEIGRAHELQPSSAAILNDAGWFYFRARRYREAIEASRRVLALEPRHLGARFCIVDSHQRLGELEEARQAALEAMAAGGDDRGAGALRGSDPDTVLESLERWSRGRLDALARGGRRVPPSPYAMSYAKLGRRDEAFLWLERAREQRDRGLLLVPVHPAYDSLRGDPRLAALLEKAGLRELAVPAAQEPAAAAM